MKRRLLSLVFCLLSIIFWIFSTFAVNWRAYLDTKRGAERNLPLSVCLMLMGMGGVTAALLSLVIYPQIPFKQVKLKKASQSFLTGVLYASGMDSYMIAANEGAPSSIAAPVSGLHVVVPVIWQVLCNRKCISMKMALGFFCSILSLFLFSGIFSNRETANSGNMSVTEQILNFGTVLLFGIGMITQDIAAEGIALEDFPQTQSQFALGHFLTDLIYSLAASVADLRLLSNWVPFGIDHWLMFLSAFFSGAGAGCFSICLRYTKDMNLMVGISSTYPIVVAILGFVFLKEPATWDILLGLIFATIGVVLLSVEATNQLANDSERSSRYQSISYQKHGDIEIKEEMPLLSNYYQIEDVRLSQAKKSLLDDLYSS